MARRVAERHGRPGRPVYDGREGDDHEYRRRSDRQRFGYSRCHRPIADARRALAFASALGPFDGGLSSSAATAGPAASMLRHAILAGLTAAGCEVQDVAIAATPTVGLAVRTLQAAGGIQITACTTPPSGTASNSSAPMAASCPPPWDARFRLSTSRGAAATVPWDRLASPRISQGRRRSSRSCPAIGGCARIWAAKLRAFLDANNGAGGPLGRALLTSLEVEDDLSMACAGDGDFLHEPEPTAANLRASVLCVAANAALGFALDPDSDRLAFIDENGRYIGEELTLALAVRFRLSQNAARW